MENRRHANSALDGEQYKRVVRIGLCGGQLGKQKAGTTGGNSLHPTQQWMELDDEYRHGFPLILSYVYMYSKLPIFGLTQEWFRELGGVHDKLHISSADWWDLLLPLA